MAPDIRCNVIASDLAGSLRCSPVDRKTGEDGLRTLLAPDDSDPPRFNREDALDGAGELQQAGMLRASAICHRASGAIAVDGRSAVLSLQAAYVHGPEQRQSLVKVSGTAPERSRGEASARGQTQALSA